MQAFGQLQGQKYPRPRRAAHAVGIKIGDADDLQGLLARNDRIGRLGGTSPSLAAAAVAAFPCLARQMARNSLRIPHGQLLSQQRLGQFGDRHVVFLTGLAGLAQQFRGK